MSTWLISWVFFSVQSLFSPSGCSTWHRRPIPRPRQDLNLDQVKWWPETSWARVEIFVMSNGTCLPKPGQLWHFKLSMPRWHGEKERWTHQNLTQIKRSTINSNLTLCAHLGTIHFEWTVSPCGLYIYFLFLVTASVSVSVSVSALRARPSQIKNNENWIYMLQIIFQVVSPRFIAQDMIYI